MRSYIVETTSGRLYLRNRKFIQRRKEKEEKEKEEEEEERIKGNEGEQQLLTREREPPRSYAAVVAAGIPAGPVTRSRARKNAV